MRQWARLTRVMLLSAAIVFSGACTGRLPDATTPPAEPPLPVIIPSDAPVAQITVRTGSPGSTIPADFLGLSYDAPLLADNHLHFDAGNEQLVNLLRNLGNGVLVYSGNGLEYTYWAGTPLDSLLARFRYPKARKVLSKSDLDRMFGFARKAGWRVIFGLNLGANNPEMAADEAAYAAQVGGDSLLAFEVGNEPDLYYRNGLRQPTYSFVDYRAEFESYLNVLRERVPNVAIAGPVTASKFEWFSSFLKDEAKNIVLATNHHYPLNADPALDATDERYASIENLLSTATTKRTADLIKQFASAAQTYGVPLRFDETNSSYPGKDGLGDTFASALWSADYMFGLAERGVVGANFFGGFVCHGYTPICQDWKGDYHAQPLYYGMLLFHVAAQGRIVPVEVNTPLNVTAHAAVANDGTLRLVIINKDGSQAVNAQIASDVPYSQATASRLTAGSLDATDGITFGGSSVNGDGTWSPRPEERVVQDGATYRIAVPAASAVVVTFK